MWGSPGICVGATAVYAVHQQNMWNFKTNLKTTLFADDTHLLCCGKNLEQLLHEVENELKKLKSWFDYNKPTLNFSKTKFIIFGNWLTATNKKLMINNVE